MTAEDPKIKLEQAVAALDAQREILGDAVVEMAIGPLREKLAALEATTVEEQRKLATILFADLVGFTALSERLDPEEVRQVQQAYFAAVTPPIQDQGGWVEKYIGDAILAVFGLPQAQENDPDRGVLAALDMQAALEGFNQRLEQEVGILLETPLQMRIGVNTGLVVVSLKGQRDFIATGDAVNLASRLQSAAPPGGVLISHDTYRHVRGAFDLQPLEPITVKGKSEAVQIYRVLAVKPRSFRTRKRGVEGIETRMVGREAELQALQNAYFMAIEDGERQMVTVVGDPGLGKSRLLYEFENWVDLRPERVTLFRGRARQETQRLPYSLLRDLFAFHFGVQDDDPLTAVWEKFETGIATAYSHTTPDPKMRSHFIGQLIGYDFGHSPHIQAVKDDPQQIRDRGLIYIIDFFKEATDRGPISVLLEDLHWADDSSLDGVARLALALHERPVLMIGATRSTLYERRQHWMEGQEFHRRLDLRPLSRRYSRQLVEDVLQKVEDIPETLRDLLIENAEGNPFYIEELVKMLVEDGVIVTSEEPWKIHPERLGQAHIPATLTGVLQARLDGLPEAERAVLQQASVVGRVFWDKIVAYLNQANEIGLDPDVIEDRLNALRNKEMVYRRDFSAFTGASEHIFKHAILREVTYESVLKRSRRKYHSMAAEWLLAQGGQRASELTGLIAEHLEQAGNLHDAMAYLRKAGEEAQASYANREAIEYYTHALALIPDSDPETHCELLLKREELYYLLGERELQKGDLASLAILIETDAPGSGGLLFEKYKPEIAFRRANYELAIGNYKTAEIEAERAVTIAMASDAPKIAISSYSIWSSALNHQSKYAAAQTRANESLDIARQIGDYNGQSRALNMLGVIAMEQADLHAARGFLQESLELLTDTAEQRFKISVRGNLAMLAGMLGDFSSAQSEYQKVLQLYQEVGGRGGESNSWGNLAWLMGMLGEYQSAYQYARQQRQIRLEIGRGVEEVVALVNMSSFARLLGDTASAIAHAQEGVKLAIEFHIPNWEAWALTVLGHALSDQTQFIEASQAYLDALTIRRQLNQPSVACEPLAGLARAALADGNLHLAEAYTRELLSYLQGGGTLDGVDEPLRVYVTCIQVLAALHDPRSDEILELAYSMLQEQAARIMDDHSRRSYLENVPWHREIVARWKTRHEKA